MFDIYNNAVFYLYLSGLEEDNNTAPVKLPKNADLSKPIPKRTG